MAPLSELKCTACRGGEPTVTWWTHKIRLLHRNDFIMAAKTDQAYVEAGR